LAAVVCEELSAAGQRFSVIDPMGVFWGLRHSADGKGPGIEVLILGGKYGDIPIEPTGGRVVADLVADESVDVVIDISRKPDGKMWSRGERIRFVADYCERLYERQGERRRPLLQIIDECGRFCPEQIRKDQPDIARCLGAVAELTEEARNVGVGVMLITQRSARMSKAVSELADAMIAFRTVGPRSVDAITDWLGEHVPRDRHKAITEELRKLPRGSALVVSPGWLEFEGVVEIRMRHTFDSSATPKAGKEQRASGKGAMPDLSRYQERMAETIERAKAADPKELHKQLAIATKRIAELEKKGVSQKSDIPPGGVAAGRKVEETRIAKWSYDQGYQAGVTQLEREYKKKQALIGKELAMLARQTKALNTQVEKELLATTEHLGFAARAFNGMQEIGRRTAEIWAGLAVGKLEIPAVLHEPKDEALEKPKPEPAEPRRAPREQNETPVSSDGVTGPQQRILDAIAYANDIGFLQPGNAMVALLAGYSPTSTSYTNPRGELRKIALIEFPTPGKLILTDEGRVKANSAGAPSSVKELQSRVLEKLPGPERKILRVLIDHYPKALTNEDCAQETGYSPTSTSYTNPRGALRSFGLIDLPKKGMVAASPALFLEEKDYETA
jgi:hypothetical protein